MTRLSPARPVAGAGALTAAAARWLAVAALVVAAGVHLVLWLSHGYRHLPVIGPLFLLDAVAGALLAALLAWRARPLTAWAGIGFAAMTLAGFLLSVYVGLFGFTEALFGTYQEVAAGAEIAAIVLLAPPALSSLLGWARRARRR